MNNHDGALSFDAYIGETDFNKSIQSMTRNISGFSNRAVSETEKIDQAFKRLGQVAAGYLTFNQLSQLPGQIVRVRGEFQQLEIALNTMLGSKSKADALMGEIVETAGSTPFGMKDLAAGTKQLLAYGSASESVISEIRMLGDVASGVSVPINDLIYLYGTLRSQGRAYAVDIRQFAGRGIPIYAELAKVLNVQVGEVNALVEAGKVGFPQVEQAFRNMTSAGGMFNNLMAEQSKSLPGLIERLKDAVDQMFNDIGRANQGTIEGVIAGASLAVEHYEDIADVLTILIATYGAYKAAVIAAHTINVVSTSSAYIAEAASLTSLLSVEAQARVSKLGLAAGSLEHAAAIKAEIAALAESNVAQVAGMRLSVATAAAKKAEALDAARNAAAKLSEARVTLATAQANQVATAQYINAKVRENAVREVAKAQDAVIAAQERASITRKAALAASSDFYTKKAALETAATTASTTAKTISAAAEVRLTAAQQLRAAVTTRLIALQTAFNASLLSNPIVLATVAFVGMTAAVWALKDSTTAQEQAQESLNKSTEEATRKKQELEGQTTSLISVIRDETQTRFAQLKAFTDLQKLYPGILGQMKLHEFQALKTADAQRMLNQAMGEMGKSDLTKQFDAAKKTVDDLGKRIEHLNKLRGDRESAGEYATLDETKKRYEAAKLVVEKLGEQIKENTRLEWEANTAPEEKKKHYEGVVSELEKERSEIEKSLAGVTGMVPHADGLKRIFSEMRLIQLNKDLIEAKGHLNEIGKETAPATKNKAYWEKQKSDAQGSLDALPVSMKGSAEWKKQAQSIAEADSNLKAYNTTAKRVAEKDKPQPFGSIAYWEQVARKAQEAIDKTNPKTGAATIKKQQEVLQNAQLMTERARLNQMPYGSLPYWEQVQKIANQIISNTPLSNASEIDKQKKIIADAQQKADDVRKVLAVRSFDEELEYKKSQYELFERWVLNLGEGVAKEQFASLVSNGGSLVDYLQSEIKKLESQRDTPGVGLIAPELEQLEKLKEALGEAKGDFTPMEKFNKQLDNIRDSSESLTDELIKLKDVQASLNPNDNSSTAVAQRQALAEREMAVLKQRKELLRDFLVSVAGSEQKRLEITKYYADLRAELEAKNLDKTTAGYKKMMAAIDDKEKKELQNFNTEAITESKGYKELEKALALTKRDDTGRRLELLKKELSQLTVGTDEYLQKLREVQEAENDHRRKVAETWGAVAGMIGDIGSSLEGFGGTLGEIGGALSGIAAGASKVSNAFANMDRYKTTDGKMSMDGYVAAAQNVIQIITGIIDAQKRRREAERQFAVERLGFENEYSLALIKKQREGYGNNPFYTDYEGKIKAGVEAYKSAFDKYQAAIDKLEEGRAKERQKNAVDGKTTLGMVGAGAAAGAIIGGVIGGGILSVPAAAAGAIIGSVVGLVGGLFAKKKKDVFGSLLQQYPELVTETAEGWAELNVEMAQALITNNQVDDKTKEMLSNAIALNEELENAKNQVRDVATELTGQLGDNLRDALVEAFKAGDTAANALRKTVGSLIADVTTKLLFSKMLGPVFDRLIDDMTNAIAEEGSPVSALDRFTQYGLPAVESYFEGLDYLDKWLKDKGYDSIKGETDQAQPMQGVIKGVSEETVSVLIGQTNAIRIYQAQMAFDVRSSLLVLTQISQNTSYNRYLVRLDDVVDRLERLNATSMRGFGL